MIKEDDVLTKTDRTMHHQIGALLLAKGAERARTVVAVVGPPASGKSTLAQRLCSILPDSAVLPMDGFHLDNDTLAGAGLLHRKGAPETFDPVSLLDLLGRIGDGQDIRAPGFDRQADRVVPGSVHIPGNARFVIVEGNYLLLDAPIWRDLRRYWDFSLYIDVPIHELERRLVQRWLDNGLPPDAARTRARQNDLVNARQVFPAAALADLVLRVGPQAGQGS